MREAMQPVSVKDFFESNGLEVVDMRSKGGCLWVIGDPEMLTPYLDQVTSYYEIEGRFAKGKATKYRSGWYTKCEK